MTKARPRSAVLALSGMFLALLLPLFAAYQLHRSWSHAQQAQANVVRCKTLAQRITSLRTSPTHAALEQQESRKLAMSIEEASRTAAIAQGGIARITPESPRRVRDTSYLEQGTRLELRHVTLQELVAFLDEVTARQPGMRVTSLRLTAPREAVAVSAEQAATTAASERWSAETTLTYLIFSPKTSRSLPR